MPALKIIGCRKNQKGFAQSLVYSWDVNKNKTMSIVS